MRQLRRFTESEKQTLLENWWDPARREEICKNLNRTNGSCAFEYYRLLRQRGISPAQHKDEMRQRGMCKSGDQELETYENLIRSDELTTYFESLLFLMKQKEPIRVSALVEELNRLRNEVVSLREQIDTLNRELASERENNRKVFEELDFYLNQFFSLSSIDKLMTLKDFVPRLKTIIDKYGVVVGVVKEGDTHSLPEVSNG